MPDRSRFPEGFLWGAATSAFQVEGSPLADGAGPSNWHRFTHLPGRTFGGQNADVACDHYRRWASDVALMRELGLGAYRLSLSWSRILPAGRGRVNPAGLDFYSRLVDALLAAGITPCVTLHHWDLPAALEDLGGWRNPEIAGWFADYARTAFAALGDRVPLWSTLNEPWVMVDAGYLHGVHAPGIRDLSAVPHVAHHLMRAHGAAVQVFRATTRGRIGLVVNLEPKVPASDHPADLAATKRVEAYMNRWYLDAALLGRYPEEGPALFGPAWPDFPDAEMSAIRQPLDFVGINYYTRGVTRADAAGTFGARTMRQPGAIYTETGWEVHPESLTGVLEWVTRRYGRLPIYVTENGAAFSDPPHACRAPLEDPLRIHYLREHLAAAARAISGGVDLRGYFVWSLLDNFEWASGYSKRFGIVHVDFETLRRTPKASARYYREVILANGASLPGMGGP